MRLTSGQQRTSSLALLSIERGLTSQINFDEIITNFENIKARKIKLWAFDIGHRSGLVECYLNLLLIVSFYRYVADKEYDTLILLLLFIIQWHVTSSFAVFFIVATILRLINQFIWYYLVNNKLKISIVPFLCIFIFKLYDCHCQTT